MRWRQVYNSPGHSPKIRSIYGIAEFRFHAVADGIEQVLSALAAASASLPHRFVPSQLPLPNLTF